LEQSVPEIGTLTLFRRRRDNGGMTSWLFSLFILFQAQAATPSPFGNADLTAAMQKSRSGRATLIYTWSPHMVLSQKGLEELLSNPEFKDTKLVVLLDPNCNKDLARQMAAQRGWPESVLRPLAAQKLIAKGARVHFPSYQFVGGGRFRGPLIPGYKAPAYLHLLARRYLK
jgi:hypothetical protein